MSPAPARASVAGDVLLRDLAAHLGGSVVVMGIGNPDRGDDGVGVRVAGLMAETLRCGALPNGRRVTVLMAEEVPESWVGPAVAARPDTVLLVDAAEMGAEPGSAALLEPEDLPAGATFTHRTPLSLLSTYLRRETGARVLLLAVQPLSVAWDDAMSPEVEAAAAHLAGILASALHSEAAAC